MKNKDGDNLAFYGAGYLPIDESKTQATFGGVDVMVLPAITDLKEAWYGMEIDKKKFKIVLEDETEDYVYLKIVKQPIEEKE